MAQASMFTFKDDGTVEVKLASKTVTLRRPTMGEYRKLREAMETAQDDVARRANALQDEVQEVNKLGADVDPTEVEARLQAMRIHTREVRDAGEATRIEWLTMILATLDRKGEEPNPDDYPPEVLDRVWIAPLIDHWRARPTDPGAP